MLLIENTKWKKLELICKSVSKDKIFILCDENTFAVCLPILFEFLPQLKNQEIIVIPPGERHKNIETVCFISDALLEKNCDRNSLLINLGGGAITDIGGFAASIFMRGIKFINIPTTLMAMADASHGGKTGVDHNGFKNILGTFYPATAVLIETKFLNSLNEIEIKSGLAEMLKHGLLFDIRYYNRVLDFDFNNLISNTALIKKSIQLKTEVVAKDALENSFRKVLNLGHSIGHAIESFALLKKRKPLPHGFAVAYGIIAELHVATKRNLLSSKVFEKITKDLVKIYGTYHVKEKHYPLIFSYLLKDKKNKDSKIKMVLLKSIGKPQIDVEVNEKEVYAALNFLNNIAL